MARLRKRRGKELRYKAMYWAAILADLGTSLLCVPEAPICAPALLTFGTPAGALLTEHASDAYEVEIQELQKWGIQ
jgi:hypothetical protein